MINLNNLKKIKRVREEDKRNFEKGIRSDRNEKVENWPSNIFQKFSIKSQDMNLQHIIILQSYYL